jgi:hypothetical protein
MATKFWKQQNFVVLFHVIQTFTEMSAAARQEGLFTCTIAKRPGINTRMW